jgi:hypothetical protein
MRLSILAAVAALALAAAAQAQTDARTGMPTAPSTNYPPTANDPAYARSQVTATANASQQFRLACRRPGNLLQGPQEQG